MKKNCADDGNYLIADTHFFPLFRSLVKLMNECSENEKKNSEIINEVKISLSVTSACVRLNCEDKKSLSLSADGRESERTDCFGMKIMKTLLFVVMSVRMPESESGNCYTTIEKRKIFG